MSSYGVGRALSSLGDGLFQVAEHKAQGARDKMMMEHDRSMEALRTKNNRQLSKDEHGRSMELAGLNFQANQFVAKKKHEYDKGIKQMELDANKGVRNYETWQRVETSHQGLIASMAENKDELLAKLDPNDYVGTEGGMEAARGNIEANYGASVRQLTELHVNRMIRAKADGYTDVSTREGLIAMYTNAGMSPQMAETSAEKNWTGDSYNPVAATEDPTGSSRTPELDAAAKLATETRNRNLAAGGPASGEAVVPDATTPPPTTAAAPASDELYPDEGRGMGLGAAGASAVAAGVESYSEWNTENRQMNEAAQAPAAAALREEVAAEMATDPRTRHLSKGTRRWNQEMTRRVKARLREQEPDQPATNQGATMAPQPAPPPPATLSSGGMPPGGGMYEPPANNGGDLYNVRPQ